MLVCNNEVNTIAGSRIRNQYLLSILSLLNELGAKNISSTVMVEAWQAKGRECNDVFFMHYDVLSTYRFIVQTNADELVVGFDKLLELSMEQDSLVSITHEGREFLDRYGSR